MTMSETITNQARGLGFGVRAEHALTTRSAYLTLWHPSLCSCGEDDCEGECEEVLMRVSDHAPTARAQVEGSADYYVSSALRGVEILCGLIGAEPTAYVKAQRTRQRAKDEARAEVLRREIEVAERQGTRCGGARAKLARIEERL